MSKSLYVDPQQMRKADTITFQDIPVNAYHKTMAEERKKYGDDNLIRIYRDITMRQCSTALKRSAATVE